MKLIWGGHNSNSIPRTSSHISLNDELASHKDGWVIDRWAATDKISKEFEVLYIQRPNERQVFCEKYNSYPMIFFITKQETIQA